MPQPLVVPLASSGNLALSTIGQYFKDTAPYQLTDYYRGGTHVPDITANAAVPLSGTIKVRDFLGASRVTVDLSSRSVVGDSTSPADSYVTYRVSADGTVKQVNPAGTIVIETWLLSGAAGDYSIRFTYSSGTATTGAAMDVWHPLSTDVDITMTRTDDVVGTTSGVVFAEIRKGSEASSMTAETITLEANVH